MMHHLDDSDGDDDTFTPDDSAFYDFHKRGKSRPLAVRVAFGAVALALAACILIFALVGAVSLTGGGATSPVGGDKGSIDVGRGDSAVSWSAPSHRLPGDVLPVRYELSLTVDLLASTPWVYGESQIAVHVNRVPANDTIILHYSGGRNMTTRDVRLVSLNGVGKHRGPVNFPVMSQPEALLFDADNDMLGLFFPGLGQFLEHDGNGVVLGRRDFLLLFDFDYELERNLAGFYLSLDDAGHPIGSTQFEAASARAAFPAFDEPGMKAVFGMSLTVPVAYRAGTLSNGPVVAVEPAATPHLPSSPSDSFVEVRFDDTPRMSTYLLAWLVSPYDSIATVVRPGLTLRCWTAPEALDEVQFALDVGRAALLAYEALFRIPFPLKKIDMAGIFSFAAGAMENWGLITYRRRALMFDESGDHSTTRNQQSVAVTVVHELAHQWFGNLVTMQWWTDLWLNEGFATFVEGMCMVDLGLSTWANFAVDELGSGLARDGLPTTKALHLAHGEEATVQEIEAQFDAISYSKGGSMLRMFSVFLGEPFWQGVRAYLTEFAYGNANYGDFFRHLGQASGHDAAHFSAWATQPGFPVVEISAVGDSTTQFVARQARFLTKDAAAVDSDNLLWYVPVYVGRVGSAMAPVPQLVEFADRESAPFVVAGDSSLPLLANIGRTGYFRVRLPDSEYEKLIEVVRTQGIAPELAGHSPFVAAGAGTAAVSAVDVAAVLSDQYAFGVDLLEPASLRRFLDLSAVLLAKGVPSAAAAANNGYAALGALYEPHKVSMSGLAALYGLIVHNDDAQALTEQFRTKINEMFGALFLRAKEDFEANSTPHLPVYHNGSAAALGHLRSWRLLRSAAFANWVHFATDEAAAKSLTLDCWNGQSFCADHVPADAESAVFNGAVKYGGQTVFDQVLARFESADESNYPAEKARLLYALGADGSPAGARRALDLALAGRIRQQDLRSLMYSISRASPEAANIAYAWVVEHWDQFSKVDGGAFNFAAGMLSGAVSSIASASKREEIAAFLQGRSKLPSVVISQILESMDSRIRNADYVAPVVQKWLQDMGQFS